MSSANGEFLKRLRATFAGEAAEHLQVIAAGLLELERTSSLQHFPAIVERVFRAAHSLKGAASAVEFTDIEVLCQTLEDTFVAWKRQESAPTVDELDILHAKLDSIAAILAAPRSKIDAPTPAADSAYEFPARNVARHAEVAPLASVREQGVPRAGETVRVNVALLDAQLLEAEEMVTAKLVASQHADELHELTQLVRACHTEWRAVESAAARELYQQFDQSTRGKSPRLLSQLFHRSRAQLRSLEGKMAAVTRAAEQDRDAVGKLVDDLMENSKRLLQLPFSSVSASFAKLARDLCRDQGKEAELHIRGEHVEIDKRILDEIKDPLIHLLRNCVDHGIESPAERVQRGKQSRATIQLSLSQIGVNKVQLTLSDDGAGIDTNKIKASAVQRGLISSEDAARLNQAQAQELIFGSEVSTSPSITQWSGRGLGLAIVKEKVANLGGEVAVESQLGVGTVFRIVVPAKRTTFRGILVSSAGQLFVVPTSQVERAMRTKWDDVQTVEGRDTISLDGRLVPLVRLSETLGLPANARGEASCDSVQSIVVGRSTGGVAFAVDAVVDEQEILVKPLAKPLERVRNVAAATVLGTGQVALVLHVGDLLKSARRVGPVSKWPSSKSAPVTAKAVLVAEDSITSRALIKNILESAGYRVATAVDGMDALTRLRAEKFDLVVTDVEMPRLNGFELTTQIRSDSELSEIPVVLVTALETRHDRERGIDVGASAYIVKSSFDQSTLVEAVGRLI